jgi:hypothetical protein
MRTQAKFLISILVLAATLLSQTGCTSSGNQAGETAAPVVANRPPSNELAIAIGAEELIESYRMEGADGAGKYKGKTLLVTGTVTRSGKDFQNNLYVNLKGENTVIEVHCIYTEDQHAAMSALKPGQQATIRGVCDGRFMSYVVLKNSVPQ